MIVRCMLCDLECKTLVIGFQGENLRTRIVIDASEVYAEYPNATPALTVKPFFGDAYPVVVERDGTDVVWDITSDVLYFRGDGEIQLTFVKDTVIAKSYVGKIRVRRSLEVTGTMPDPIVQWIENANRKLAEVDAQIVELEGMVDTATDAATRAEQSASTASTKAEQAAGSAATATAKATEATNAARTATAKAAEAQTAAQTATEKATAAAESERIATAKAVEATTAATTATAKAEQATEAAQTATEKAGEASASATAAQASASNAASSATAASESETAAKASETAASTSATQAAQSVLDAGANAQTAMQKAAEASQSASNAATSATNAATSAETASTKAEEAAQSAQAASDAKTAVEQTAEQLAESLEQIEQNTQDIADHEQYAEATYAKKTDLYKKADIIHNTASGAIASFVDGAEMPVDEVTAQINPVQDLHGYDHPWPAGGGKNLFHVDSRVSKTIAGVTYTSDDDYVYLNGTKSGQGYATLNELSVTLEPGTYYARAFAVGGTSTNTIYIYANNGTNDFGGDILGLERTYTISETTTVFFRFLLSVDGNVLTNYKIGIVISKASGIEKFSPYSNICPITGWDGVKVTRTGKNLWNKDDQTAKNGYYNLDGSFNFNPTWRAIAFSCQQGFTYTKSGDGWGGIVTYWYDDTFVSSTNSSLVTVPSGVNNVRFACQYSSTNAQLELSSTATDYEPYAGNTYSITLPTEAGTVYGGTLDVSTGELVVDTISVELTGTAIRSNWDDADRDSMGFYVNADSWTYNTGLPNPVEGDGIFSYCYNDSVYLTNNWWAARFLFTNGSFNRFEMRIPKNVLTSLNVSGAKAYLNEHPLQVVYKVAPLTYTLTPTEIRTLLGTNNIWADTGDVSVKYKADTKLYIDGKIAELVAQIVNS